MTVTVGTRILRISYFMKKLYKIPKVSKREIPKLRRKLTLVFNKFIRLRDKDKGCISCVTGRVENAGHFKSKGAQPKPSMAFSELNVAGQCIHCNFTLGGNPKGYEKGLVKRYGKGILEKLEIQAALKQNPWTRFEFQAMIDLYTQKLHGLRETWESSEWLK